MFCHLWGGFEMFIIIIFILNVFYKKSKNQQRDFFLIYKKYKKK